MSALSTIILPQALQLIPSLPFRSVYTRFIMGHKLGLDAIGWTYVGLAIAWTITLALAMTFLFTHRRLPALRMRRLPLLLASTIALHIYAVLCFLSYPLGPAIPCAAEFWVMSIYLPLGIALFHASNSQFLYLASRQKQFAHMSSLKDHKFKNEEKAQNVPSSRWKRAVASMRQVDTIQRTLVFIGIGLVVQVSSPCITQQHIWTNSPSSLRSHFLCSLAPRSSTPVMVFSIIPSKVPKWKLVCAAVQAGNGGSLLYGSCSGHG